MPVDATKARKPEQLTLSSDKIVAVSQDDYGGNLASYIEWTCPSDGTYYVVVHAFSDSQSGTFTVSVNADSDT
eukprot:SAG11_NODE_30605_length_299_cov_1.035000_1_plen_72_part_01